ncbi:DUF3606 domain-containing protein [Methylibium rhizosphaerae]|jgi:hypothetical protein|uniref:DUF3606 domain-containing protein n=1 Tax=Methylibium rhizosphaerae TaxID=2570323 RepID=UPI00112E1B05|nr:DUF3606 domain-containing protein [Methylibium rhizosphaerae]
MPYSLKSRGEQYYLCINLNWDWEVAYWMETLDATAEELQEAVRSVGSEINAVKNYLARDPRRAAKAAPATAVDELSADPPALAGLS